MFVAVGVIGAVLLIVFLVFDDFLDEFVPDADWISGPVIGAFLAAFGLFGWMVQSATDAAAWVAAVVGLAGGVGLGYGTYRLTKALAETPTDATPTQRDLIGRPGHVITAISAGRLGEVLVSIGGQSVKLAATAEPDTDIQRGTQIVVIEVTSPTRVVVQAADRFWGTHPQP